MPHANSRMVRRYIDRFQRDERYAKADEAITELIRAFPSNADLSAVLLKVTAINKLYSTNIMAPFNVAKHIAHLHLDADIQAGILSAVDAIWKSQGTRKHYFSFATKYCSWHNLTAYPIYDSFVAKSLAYYGTVVGDLREVGNLKASIDKLVSRDNLAGFTYKQLDKFLWLRGKEL